MRRVSLLGVIMALVATVAINVVSEQPAAAYGAHHVYFRMNYSPQQSVYSDFYPGNSNCNVPSGPLTLRLRITLEYTTSTSAWVTYIGIRYTNSSSGGTVWGGRIDLYGDVGYYHNNDFSVQFPRLGPGSGTVYANYLVNRRVYYAPGGAHAIVLEKVVNFAAYHDCSDTAALVAHGV